MGDGGYLLALESRGYVQAGSHDECRRLFDDQIRFQMAEGVDFFIAETFLYVGEALLALERIKKAGLPAVVTLAFEGPKTRDGKTAAEAAKMLEGAGADPGQKGFPDRLDPYQLTRYEMGDFAQKARDMGVNFIGGCCGCQGAHIRQMARALGKKPREEREWKIDYAHPQPATEAYKKLRES